ncbi:hypothetical protein CHS0354_001380 [Potamilus streckersoni]|uniref:Egal-1 winged helix domain-containing protein n=1 Tax=Potamilus streckersoni TaxID=2493646 RepID=A0AAE0SPZ3_9BIVA|nr:hypothetical protein CHS0354_001380 [Potamilus streckersoni]
MADDPGHKAMLYFLEILMNSSVPLTISQLAGRFGGRNFSPDMRQAAGGNEAGLKKFLLKYPSLFSVNGNLVNLNDGTASLGKNFREGSPASFSSLGLPDISTETEAVQYFRARLNKKGEKWMPIKSLAGHLSQASAEIRECVGPQNEFEGWLLKHPLIFELNGEMVCLKDNINYSAVNPNAEPIEEVAISTKVNLMGINQDQQTTPKQKHRPKSIEIPQDQQKLALPKSPAPVQNSKSGPSTMTANEYKAVMFIKGIIEKKGDMKMNSLTGHFSQAPESLRNTIGWSRPELECFVRAHSNLFIVGEDETVSVVKNARLNVIITGSRPPASPRPGVTNRKGRIYHVAKLWGIIDLGRHEHVFIDRSIFGKHIDDLNKLLTVGEMVCFDAIPASKGSRARWRATRVWKEHESIEELIDRVVSKLSLPIDGILKEPMSPLSPLPQINIDEEIRRMIPEMNDNTVAQSPLNIGGFRYSFADAAPSGAGVVPVWNFGTMELSALQDFDDFDLSDDSDAPSLSMVAERYYMNRSVLGDSPQDEKLEKLRADDVNGVSEESKQKETGDKASKGISTTKNNVVNAGCQTIVTGDVLATQLFHEDI